GTKHRDEGQSSCRAAGCQTGNGNLGIDVAILLPSPWMFRQAGSREMCVADHPTRVIINYGKNQNTRRGRVCRGITVSFFPARLPAAGTRDIRRLAAEGGSG